MPEIKSIKTKRIWVRAGIVLFFFLLVNPVFALTQLSVSSVTASSAHYPHVASNTIDNNYRTYWRGTNNKFPYWLDIDWSENPFLNRISIWWNKKHGLKNESPYWLDLDLGKACTLNRISIWWNKKHGSTDYNIQGSANGSSWENLYTFLTSSGGTKNPYKKDYSLSGSYRYVRIYINKVQRVYPIIYEVKLYGTSIDVTPPTGTIAINNGAQYTNAASVTLNLSATDTGSGVSQMQFSSDNSTWSTPEAFATTKAWNISTGDGTKRVYVKFKDTVGNWSTAYSATIILDTIPPQINIISPQDNEIINA
ncbi:MAG: discoidin domain-containing protein [Nitrospirota bacterium]